MKSAAQNIPDDEFHLGITMAGAVSAGCYTGGVMDYLFEVLDLWEQAKNGVGIGLNDDFKELVPKHKVIIDVMGGASAGGMTTSMSAIHALKSKRKPVTDPDEPVIEHKDNVFYDSWVGLNDPLPTDDKDAQGRKSFEQMWALDDLKDGAIPSLLNSAPIDAIARRAFQVSGNIHHSIANLPDYIAPDLEVLLSICMLRGLPLEVDFRAPIRKQTKLRKDSPRHSTWEHYTLAHFKLSEFQPSDHLWLNPFDPNANKLMELCTIATGAFPIGLKYRKFTQEQFSNEYLKKAAERIIYRNYGGQSIDGSLEWENLPDDFSFIAVDGGTINNEPYGEVMDVLKSRHGDCREDEYKKYGVLMIDPFPDRASKDPNHPDGKYHEPGNIFGAAAAIITTLKNQGRVKRHEFQYFIADDYLVGSIFPKKWTPNSGPERWPIASESFAAFGGFLHEKFRHHDYFLGRNNARSFLRYFFSLPYVPSEGVIHPIHRGWSDQMIEAFIIDKQDDGSGYLPIIPDLNLLIERQNQIEIGFRDYDVPKKHLYDPTALFRLEGEINSRLRLIASNSIGYFTTPKSNNQFSEISEEWLKSNYRVRWWKRPGKWFGRLVLQGITKRAPKNIADAGSKALISWIVRDLEAKNILKRR